MDRRLAHAGPHSDLAPRRRFQFTASRLVVSAVASIHRWRRQVLRVWNPIDAFAGLVLMGLLGGSCWTWCQLIGWISVILL